MKAYRLFTVLAALVLVVGLGWQPRQVIAHSAQVEVDAGALYVPGEVIVGFVEGKSSQVYQAQASALASEVGAQVVDSFANVALLQFAEDADVAALVAQIGGMAGVAYAEPNYVRWIPEYLADPTGAQKDKWVSRGQVRQEVTFRLRDERSGQEHKLTLTLSELRSMKSIRNGKMVPTWPTDPDAWTQWGWWFVMAYIIWPDKAVNPGVCVVDTGVDGKHPDLAGQVLAGYDFVNEDTKPDDDNGHGTHVAGIIAATINNKKGFAGISTAKVVPVKVLSAQGWGTVFDIAQGILYCANRTDVRVINMSLGGYGASQTEYGALDTAINGKGKLVVAAAGNSSTYALHFPAAWAVNWVCRDGTDNYPNPCNVSNPNALAPGLISVGAAEWWSDYDANGDYYLWVDVNGDGVEPSASDPDFWDEHFWPEECAADFSNYGAWVEMVAPGVGIYSTQPVSYNFWNRYLWGADWDGDGYEWYSGTSMATPHVAGGAARVWSVFPLNTNVQIAERLQIAPGVNRMAFAMDPNMNDPENGYRDTGYQGEVPYCWPDDTFGGKYDMAHARYLNVAGAMERAARWENVSEAITGLPLEKATVTALVGTTTTVRDKAIVGRDSSWVILLNLVAGTPYRFVVGKAGYTSGNVDIYPNPIVLPGGVAWGAPVRISIPPMGRITAVIDTFEPVDLYAWLPQSVPGGGAVVGWDGLGHPKSVGPGELSDFPRARWNRDAYEDWVFTESITILPRPGFPTIPYYNQTFLDYYDFLLTDYGEGSLNLPVIFRAWVGGKVIGYVEKTDSCDTDGADDIPGTSDDEVWWWAGWMQFGTFTPADFCGSASDIWPYATGGGRVIRGVPERPATKR